MSFHSLLLILTACAIVFTSATAPTPHSLAHWSSRHKALQPFQKRASGQFTYYAVGMGACGKQNADSDFIVALNTPSWDGGSHCFETITITVNGMTAQAQIVDRCESCGSQDLDFSPGLFHYFGGTDGQGVLSGTWTYGSDEPKSTSTTTTSSIPPPSPTSTSASPSSTSTVPPSSTSEPSKTSSSSSSSSSIPSPSTSGSPAPTPTGVLAQSLFAIGELGGLVIACENAQ